MTLPRRSDAQNRDDRVRVLSNVRTIHSVEAIDGAHLLTMELVEGQSLARLIPEDGIPVERLPPIRSSRPQARERHGDDGRAHSQGWRIGK